jgi:hypothetical protein
MPLEDDVHEPDPPAASAVSGGDTDAPPTRIYLISYPKIVFLYPSFLAALAVGIWSTVRGGDRAADTEVGTLIFLGILGVNLVVFSFDFPRGTSLTLFFVLAALVLGGWVLSLLYPDLLPAAGKVLGRLRPYADAQFYYIFTGLLALMYLAMWAAVRLDYWEVRPNELLHHHGLLSDLERFAAPNLRIDKEINDVFEYLLLKSGRLILHPSQERRAIVLENVIGINRKEEQLTRMLSALQVHIRKEA